MAATPSFYSRVFALSVAAALAFALLLIFKPFALPMTWAAFLAFLLFPVNLRWRRRLRGADRARTDRHSFAVERTVGRVRVANIGVAAANAKIRHRDGYQVVLGSPTISLDRADQYLVAGARRYLG
jgi:membrane protein implicated in regulation of membrane protease activity